MEEEARGSSMFTKRRLVVIVTVVTLVAVSLVAVSVGVYWERQGPPPLLTPPYIRLEALLDEPMGHGWGVDIPGWALSQLLFSAGCCSWSDRPGQFTLLLWPHLKLQAHTLKPAEGDRHEDMHQFFSPFPEQGFCPRGAVCGQVPFSEDLHRSTCLPYSTQVRFTAAGLGRCMEASEAEVKH